MDVPVGASHYLHAPPVQVVGWMHRSSTQAANKIRCFCVLHRQLVERHQFLTYVFGNHRLISCLKSAIYVCVNVYVCNPFISNHGLRLGEGSSNLHMLG